MKIAVASEGKNVCPHFGHCPEFSIFTAEDGNIVIEDILASPGHDHNLIEFLNDRGVNVIISGGMGAGAREKFDEKHIEIVTGAQGPARDAALDYLAGTLVSDDSVCCKHEHAHECHK